MKLLDVPGLLEEVSKAIHLEEWCPERARCSGTSAHSNASARAALAVLDERLPQLLLPRPPPEVPAHLITYTVGPDGPHRHDCTCATCAGRRPADPATDSGCAWCLHRTDLHPHGGKCDAAECECVRFFPYAAATPGEPKP